MIRSLRASKGCYASRHREAGRGLCAVGLVDACQFYDRLGTRQPAKAPAGHGIGLGETIDDDGALGHPRLGRQAVVHMAVIDDVLVDLVAHHVEIMRGRHMDDGIDLGARQHTPRRVVRAVDHE